MTGPEEWKTWSVLADFGATEPDRQGYDVHASLVQTPRGDTRVRLTLRRNGELIARLDMSSWHGARLGPLLMRGIPPVQAKETD